MTPDPMRLLAVPQTISNPGHLLVDYQLMPNQAQLLAAPRKIRNHMELLAAQLLPQLQPRSHVRAPQDTSARNDGVSAGTNSFPVRTRGERNPNLTVGDQPR